MAQSSEIKLLKRFDQNVEITGTLTVGGVSVSPSSYLTSIPSEYLTQTEGDARYIQSIPSEYLTQTEGDARYLQSYTLPSPLSKFSDSSWAGSSGYPGYTFTGGNSRFGFSSTSGVVDMYVDGNYYATDSKHLVIHAGNIGSQSVSYATSSGSAGSAGSAGYASTLQRYDNRTISPSEYPAGRMSFGFTSFNNNNTAPWADFIHLRGYTDSSGGNDNMLVFSKSSKDIRLYQQSYGSSTAYSSYVDIIHSGNIGSQSVSYASNAGTLDGVDSSQFLRSDVSDTVSGTVTFTSRPIVNTGATENGIRFRGSSKDFVGRYSDYVSLFNQISGGEIRMYDTDYIILDSPDVRVAGNHQVVHGGNIGSQSVNYASSAGSVSWGNVSSKPASWLDHPNLISNSNPNATAFPSGFYEHSDGANTPTGTWFNYINVRHSNVGNGHGYQLGMSYYDNNLWFRSYKGGTSPTFESWETAIGSGSSNQTKNGFLQSNNSLRAPIFYDSDDTTRYVNPNGQTVLNSGAGYETLIVTGEYPQITVRRTSVPDASIHYDAGYAKKWNVGPGAGGAEEDEFGFAIYSAPRGTHYGTPMRINAETQNVMIGDADHPSFKLDVRGQIRATSDIRGTLFYDENNTSYYLDSDADLSLKVYGEICNSNVYGGNLQPGALNIGRTDTNYAGIASWAGDVRFGILANCADEWEFGIHDSGTSVESVFLYQNSNGSITMGRDVGWGTTPIIAANSFRAPIFYDSNNTGYYCDPEGTSRFATLDFGLGGTSRNGAVATALGDGALHVRSTADKYHKMWYYDGIAFGTNYSHGHFRFYAEDNSQRNNSTGGYQLRFDIDTQNAITTAHGTLKSTGDIVAYSSDERLKENIKPIESPIEKIKQIRGVTYDWKDVIDDLDFKPRNRKNDVGVIAQEVEKVLPQVVALAPFDTEMDDEKEIAISKSGENYKTVQYEKIVPLLIESIKELSNKVEELENKLNGTK